MRHKRGMCAGSKFQKQQNKDMEKGRECCIQWGLRKARQTQNRKMVLRHGGAPLVTESKGGGKTRDKNISPFSSTCPGSSARPPHHSRDTDASV